MLDSYNYSYTQQQRICRNLILKQNFQTIMAVPKLTKVVLNSSTNLYVVDRKNLLTAMTGLEYITGQKPKYSQAKKSVASFKLREQQVLGCNVTLRKEKLFNFLTKYVNITAPSIRELTFQFLNFKNYDTTVRNFNSFLELQKFYEQFHSLRGVEVNFTIQFPKKNVSKQKKEKQSLLIYSAYRLPAKLKRG